MGKKETTMIGPAVSRVFSPLVQLLSQAESVNPKTQSNISRTSTDLEIVSHQCLVELMKNTLPFHQPCWFMLFLDAWNHSRTSKVFLGFSLPWWSCFFASTWFLQKKTFELTYVILLVLVGGWFAGPGINSLWIGWIYQKNPKLQFK